MTKLVGTVAIAAILLGPLAAAAQEGEWHDTPAPQEQPPQAPPPAPPGETPPPPQQPEVQAPAPEAPAQAAVPQGQWVWTQQYGWIWMPYSDAYTQVPSGGYGAPYAYVYYPAYSCWTWVAAPWIWGIGPWPWFGGWGPVRFAWYGHGWWNYPTRWHYVAPRYAVAAARPWNGGRGFAPAPAYRPGTSRGTYAAPGARPGAFAPAPRATSPAPRGAPVGSARGFAPSRGFAPPQSHAFVGGGARGGSAHVGGSFAARGGGRSGGVSSGGHGGGHGRGRG